eukprot:13659103-Alexandrium_andersonii.AAC.1
MYQPNPCGLGANKTQPADSHCDASAGGQAAKEGRGGRRALKGADKPRGCAPPGGARCPPSYHTCAN